MIDLGRNRDNAHIWLEECDNNIYKICTDNDFIFTYSRIVSSPADEDDYDMILYHSDKLEYVNIEAFDPSGGPYISVGNHLPYNNQYKVERIFHKMNDENIFIKLSDI